MFRITIIQQPPLKVLKRELRAAWETGLRNAVLLWHRKFAPQHFKHGAAARYGYAERGAKYRKRKFRKYGHNRPLEFTGLSKRQLLRYIRVTSAASKRKLHAAGAMIAPRYFWMTPAGHPNKPEELKRTLPTEQRALQRTVEKTLTRHLARAARHKSKRRIR